MLIFRGIIDEKILKKERFTINELEEDIILQEDSVKQQLPVIGEINIDG